MAFSNEYLNNGAAITGLTGGGASKLDGIATAGVAGLSAGSKTGIRNGSNLAVYEIRTSTETEFSPFRIRPDDYAASTNEKVWYLLPETSAGCFFTANGDPGFPFDIEGRGRLIHGLTMQGLEASFAASLPEQVGTLPSPLRFLSPPTSPCHNSNRLIRCISKLWDRI